MTSEGGRGLASRGPPPGLRSTPFGGRRSCSTRCADILPGLKDARTSNIFNRERADAVEGTTDGAPPCLQFHHPRNSVNAGIGLSDPTQGPEQWWRRLVLD